MCVGDRPVKKSKTWSTTSHTEGSASVPSPATNVSTSAIARPGTRQRPGVADQDRALDLGELAQASGDRGELGRLVARAVDADTSGVRERWRRRRELDGRSRRSWRSTGPPSKDRDSTGTTHDEPIADGRWRART